MKTWRYILLPFSLFYGIVVMFRNLFYDLGIFKSKKFDKPVILVGNLTVGGTGKTPHVESLVRILESERIAGATLSRGYGRKTSGMIDAKRGHTALEIGDEPKQIRQKFPNIVVVADGNRRRGIDYIFREHPNVKAIVMDDGFQHRSVKPSLSILLQDYNELEERNFLLPAGTLREPRSAARRADALIISKTPGFFSPMEKRLLKERIRLYASQQVFFTYMRYGGMFSVVDDGKPSLFDKEYYIERNYKVLCVTGIANSGPFCEYLTGKFGPVEHLEFPDHHRYRAADVKKMVEAYEKMPGDNKLVLTTEKDAMRLMQPELKEVYQHIPLFFISIEVGFHHDDYAQFKSFILDHLKPYTTGRSIFAAKV